MIGRPTCPHEDATRRAVRTGRWDEALRDHAARCAVCREVSIVGRGLWALANLPTPYDSRRPDPVHIWWKARLLGGLSLDTGPRGPLMHLEDLGYVVAAVPIAVLLWTQWPTWQTEFVRLWMSHAGAWFPYADAIWRSLALTVLAVGVGLLGSVFSWVLGRLLTDE